MNPPAAPDDEPMQLTWEFEWSQNRAFARAPHGTYVVTRLPGGAWDAKFTRADTESHRRTQRSIAPRIMTFTSVAEAIHACKRHAEQYSPESSNQFTIATPLPE